MMKNILLIGLGRFGRHIAMELNELGHEIMAVDVNEGRVDKVLPYVTNAQIGDSTNAEFLESLGIGNYDICFVTIGGSFQNSLENTSLLKELGAKMVISRAERDVQEKFLLRNGADKVIYPEKQVAKWASIRYTDDHILCLLYTSFFVPEWNEEATDKFAELGTGPIEPLVLSDFTMSSNMTGMVLYEQIYRGYRTVSYTHLDVYKRQVCVWKRWLSMGHRR